MTSDMSPKVKARLVGGLLLLTMLAGGFAQGFIGGPLIVSGDAPATAASIAAHAPLHRLSFPPAPGEMGWRVAVVPPLFPMPQTESRRGSFVAAPLGLVGCT